MMISVYLLRFNVSVCQGGLVGTYRYYIVIISIILTSDDGHMFVFVNIEYAIK